MPGFCTHAMQMPLMGNLATVPVIWTANAVNQSGQYMSSQLPAVGNGDEWRFFLTVLEWRSQHLGCKRPPPISLKTAGGLNGEHCLSVDLTTVPPSRMALRRLGRIAWDIRPEMRRRGTKCCLDGCYQWLTKSLSRSIIHPARFCKSWQQR